MNRTIESAWSALAREALRIASMSPDELASQPRDRFRRFVVEAAGLRLDYSRQRVDEAVLERFVDLAEATGLRAAIQSMFRGDIVNPTEKRAALHVALRQPAGAAIGGLGIESQVLAERERMLAFASRVRSGEVAGSSGVRFRDVINIGIGGSDLGPAMAVEALKAYTVGGPRLHFVSNVDGCALVDALAHCEPATTLFIVASKTFTTQETMTNARSARAWMVETLGEAAVPEHFAAVSVNSAAMDSFGVHPEYRFAMWDWVGGRYSMWSSIGVSLAIAIGPDAFGAFLAGGHEMDLAFLERPWETNLPALMALLGAWNIDILGLPTLAVLPYDSRLARFPAYLQQLDMESNGKSVTTRGEPVARGTAPVVWGEPGNNAQHSFFQLLHQGRLRAALDMFLPLRSSCDRQEHHDLAIANCLAQAEVFMRGQKEPGTPAHKVHQGGRPLSLLTFERTDPRTLGALVAAYEHKVFAQSVLWQINAFDQWGVELGKLVAGHVLGWMRDPATAADAPPSIAVSLELLREARR